jgi:hypothetical protein
MLAPILPSPIIPSCILLFFLCAYLLQLIGACRIENVDELRDLLSRGNLRRLRLGQSSSHPNSFTWNQPRWWKGCTYKSLLYRRLITWPPSVCGRD